MREKWLKTGAGREFLREKLRRMESVRLRRK